MRGTVVPIRVVKVFGSVGYLVFGRDAFGCEGLVADIRPISTATGPSSGRVPGSALRVINIPHHSSTAWSRRQSACPTTDQWCAVYGQPVRAA